MTGKIIYFQLKLFWNRMVINSVKQIPAGRHLKILLKEFDFALILMDVKMPNLNGFETASIDL